MKNLMPTILMLIALSFFGNLNLLAHDLNLYDNRQDLSKDLSEKDSFGNTASDYMFAYCNEFLQIPLGRVGSQLKKMEKTGFSVEKYFTLPHCQPARYSDAVKSPLLHIIVDEPFGREKFLQLIIKYFTIVSKKPEVILSAVNAKNTKGETLLDYIETLKTSKSGIDSEQILTYNDFSTLICANGGKYDFYKNKSC